MTFCIYIYFIILRWAEYVAHTGANRSACKVLVGKLEGNRPPGRRGRGRIILKYILRDMGWGGMDWIDLAQDRDQWRTLVNTVMNLQVP
jgi:hypothetical protein